MGAFHRLVMKENLGSSIRLVEGRSFTKMRRVHVCLTNSLVTIYMSPNNPVQTEVYTVLF